MTIDEIAKIANTSKATVSLALNNKPGVNADTRKRILDIAARVGYVIKKRVSSSALKHTGLLKLIAVRKPETSGIHNFGTSFFAELINSIQGRCAALGYNLVYTTLDFDDFVSDIWRQELSQPCDGILLIGTYLDESEIAAVSTLNTRLVVVDHSTLFEPVNTVVMNNFMGSYVAAKHLISLGHRNIGYLRSVTRISNLEERSRGFFKAASDFSLAFDENNIFSVNSYLSHSVDNLCDLLKGRGQLPDAFFCENDYNAICLVSALTRLGYAIPHDISVIGFDNVPETRMMNPRLTTVAVDRNAIGVTAVNRLHQMITKEDNISLSILVDVKLIERDSTAACLAADHHTV
ncbi:MAG: LacI family DNA-binding transcriptional regulator [Oscillospiraceae bacterium]